ncbi:uncharacterized protein SOCEGT47_013560 [Sorangium cellulosum]|uniref:Zinc-finger domain-containing protein n=1 Tax=Sorangium cellulosum TaxID=56 RepID=A0A4P2PW33_SORCE|nr:tetratricopeptide repeat protein [Sorangium cellulosum]AUX20880.1 uncharacterized protein SOCEGT47_013560 [Sorangium cellulosum]
MSPDCRSELLVRVRRGAATEPDRLAFDAHLGTCASCRMSWELARAFDAVGAAEPGDAELLARIARVAIGEGAFDPRRESAPVRPDNDVGRRGDVGRGGDAGRGSDAGRGDDVGERGSGLGRGGDAGEPGSGLAGRRGAGWRRGAWLYAVAAVLAGGVAAAAAALVQGRPAPEATPSARRLEPPLRGMMSRPRAAAPPEAVPPASGAAPVDATPAPSSAPAPAGAPPPRAAPEPAAPAARPRGAARGPSAAAPPATASSPMGSSAAAASAVTAEQLFREANDARRAGSARRAIALYRALQQGFAASPEATLSLVSLGSLLLDTGAPAAALAQFDRYLAAAGSRALAVEALYGRGRALRALGRSGDEAQTWRRLLREHPSSPYAEHARRRLTELGG